MEFPADLARINTDNYKDFDQWSKRFDVTSSDVKSAIRAVGSVAHAVEQYLLGTRLKSSL
jgi:hypothetical protein